MKKLFVLALTVVFMISMATVSLAGTTNFSDAKVELTFGANSDSYNGFGGVQEGKVKFDFTKVYNDQLSAGVVFQYKNGVDHGVDTNGWIKFNYSPLVVQLNTSLGGRAGKSDDLDLWGCAFGLPAAPGMQVDYAVIPGMNVTVAANDSTNFLGKASFESGPVGVGAGYQDDKADVYDAVAAWGSLKIGDVATVGGEYNNRLNAEATAILATASSNLGPLSVNGKFYMSSGGFVTIPGWAAGWAIDEAYSAYGAARAFGWDANVVVAELGYKVSDTISVGGNVNYILSGTTDGTVALTSAQCLSYKGNATLKATEKVTLDAWYKGYGDASQVAGKVNYNFAGGLDGNLEVDFNNFETLVYTFKVTAGL